MLGLSEWSDLTSSPQWLKKLREQQWQAFITQGLPTRKLEDWHYTDISAIKQHALKSVGPVDVYSHLQALQESIVNASLSIDSHLLVFVDGKFNATLSKIPPLAKGMIVSNIATIMNEQPDLIKPHLEQYAEESQQHSLVCFNTAMVLDGAFIYVPDNIQVSEPVHIVSISSTGSANYNTSHLRHIIVSGQNSFLNVFEEYKSLADLGAEKDFQLHTIVTQIYAAKNAVINHYKLQNENATSYHVAYTTVKQEQDSCLHSYNIALGAFLARDTLQVDLNAAGAQCRLSGLYLLAEQQHIDQHILVNHYAGSTNSEQLYRGVVNGEATSVFNGCIKVHPGAQKSRATQMNHNLLLSKSATANTKPELEIYADDVQCSHGATVGHIDETAYFYLRSRGLDEHAATNLLMDAFTGVILNQLAVPAIAEKIIAAQRQRISTWN